MIVCLCEGVSDRTIRKVIHQGAGCAKTVGQACGAGTHCGQCRRMIRELVRDRDATGPMVASRRRPRRVKATPARTAPATAVC